jgi:hypothetical protein
MSNRSTKKKTVFSGCGIQLVSIPALDNSHHAGERESFRIFLFFANRKRDKRITGEMRVKEKKKDN